MPNPGKPICCKGAEIMYYPTRFLLMLNHRFEIIFCIWQLYNCVDFAIDDKKEEGEVFPTYDKLYYFVLPWVYSFPNMLAYFFTIFLLIRKKHTRNIYFAVRLVTFLAYVALLAAGFYFMRKEILVDKVVTEKNQTQSELFWMTFIWYCLTEVPRFWHGMFMILQTK